MTLSSPVQFLLLCSYFLVCFLLNFSTLLFASTFCFLFLPVLLSATLSSSMLPLSIFLLLSSTSCAVFLRYLTSYLLLFCPSILSMLLLQCSLPFFVFFFNLLSFSWFLLVQSPSLSPFDSILFHPPAALLVLFSGSLLTSQLAEWLNFLGL